MAANPLAVVALGSNLGNPEQNIRRAIEELRCLAKGDFSVSSLWRSAPVDCPPESPFFVNAVVIFRVSNGETPESLLAKLQGIERAFGRVPKSLLNEPRPLDLDLIAFDDETRDSRDLVLPHPRAHLRRFVFEPLNEIAPDLVLPGQYQTVSELVAKLPPDPGLRKLPS